MVTSNKRPSEVWLAKNSPASPQFNSILSMLFSSIMDWANLTDASSSSILTTFEAISDKHIPKAVIPA